MIGALQWVISLGRFDIGTAIMTMSHFHVALRQGNFSQVKHIYGLLARNPDGVIQAMNQIILTLRILDMTGNIVCIVMSVN